MARVFYGQVELSGNGNFEEANLSVVSGDQIRSVPGDVICINAELR